MKATREYMQYAPIRHHLRQYQLERTVGIAEAIAGAIARAWKAISEPDPNAAYVARHARQHRVRVGRLAHR